MIVNVKELCDNDTYYGKIGDQSKNMPYDWEGFKFPEKVDIKILNIHMSYDKFSNITNEVYMQGASISLLIGETEISYEIVSSEVKDGIIVNYIDIPIHHYLGFDKNEVTDRFITRTKEILIGTWAGTNNHKKCDSLKNYLLNHKVEYFQEKYPELLV